MERQAIIGDTRDGGRRADEAERHIYKRVEGEFRSGTVERDDECEAFVLRNPLLAWKTLMNKTLVSGDVTSIKSRHRLA